MRNGHRFSEVLRAHRLRAGLTQRVLADLSTISARAIRDLEAGRARGRTQTVTLLADGLRLTGLTRAAFLDAARAVPGTDPDMSIAVDGIPPAAADRLVGRVSETRRLLDALAAGHRLISVCGLGGVGKTRLVTELARQLHYRRNWPVLWVAAGPTATSGLTGPLAHQLQSLLHAPDPAGAARLAHLLGRHDVVAVLDGLTDLAAAADTFDSLLRRCPGLRIITTSRAPLPESTAYTMVVAPLATPPYGLPSSTVTLAGVPAVRLFLDHLAEVRPEWTLTARDVPAVGSLCRQLDGLPAALRLAANRAAVHPVPELARRPVTDFLRQELPPARPNGHRTTVAGLVAASCRLLSEAERTQLRVLAGLDPPWTVRQAADALRRTCTETVDTLVVLTRLGLARRFPHQPPPRFALLRLVRAYLRTADRD